MYQEGTTNYLQGFVNWNEGKTFILTKDNDYWCTNCTFIVTLKATKGTSFLICSEAYKDYRELKMNEKVRDASTYS